jgi:putative transposase
MSRLRRIADRDRIFFITTNLAAGIQPLAARERDPIARQLKRQRDDGDFSLFGYVIMPTHLHLLLAPAKLDLTALTRELKKFTAQEISKARDASGPIWQPRYFDFILRRVSDCWDKLQYIHENPVRAGLVHKPTEWKWSSATHYASQDASSRRSPAFPAIDKIDLPADRDAPLYPAKWP